MKKFLKTLVLAVMCLAVMSVAAFAAENIAPNSDGTFSASYANGTDGEYYALVVVSGIYTEGQTPAISENTVLHIDQVTAGASGATFDDFVPRTNDAATVFVGGSDLDNGPAILGHINAEEPVKEYKVSVAVTAASDAAATVVLTAGETTVNAVYNAETGKYEATVDEGTYKLTVSVPKHLSYTVNALEVAADVEKAVTVKGGDLNNTGKVDKDDLSILLKAYNTETDDSDINGSGKVDKDDLSILLKSYNQSSSVE